MSWLNHPKYIRVREEFLGGFSPWRLSLFLGVPKIVFICGAKNSTRRKRLEDYFRKNLPRFLFFRAEDAWDAIQSEMPDTNALQLEEKLAEYSDAVIILVESFGTVAELGAFSQSQPLRKKLLVILDKKYEREPSFINTGPVRWIDSESYYRPCIYTNMDLVLENIGDIEKRLRHGVHKEDVSERRNTQNKRILLFIVQLIAVLGPISSRDLEYCLDRISKKAKKYGSAVLNGVTLPPKEPLRFLLSFAVALKLIMKTTFDGEDFYYCPSDSLINKYIASRVAEIVQRERAKMLGASFYIGEFREVLTSLGKRIC